MLQKFNLIKFSGKFIRKFEIMSGVSNSDDPVKEFYRKKT